MSTTWLDVLAVPMPPALVGIRSISEGQRRLAPAAWHRILAEPVYPVALAWASRWERPGAPGAERAEAIARRAVVAAALVREGQLSPDEGRRAALRPDTRHLPRPDWADEELVDPAHRLAQAQVSEVARWLDLPSPGRDYLVSAATDWFCSAEQWPCPLAELAAHLTDAGRLWRQVVRPGLADQQNRAARHLLLGTPQMAGALVVAARRQQPATRLVAAWATSARLLDPAADPTDRTAEQRARRLAVRRAAIQQAPTLDLLEVAHAALGIPA